MDLPAKTMWVDFYRVVMPPGITVDFTDLLDRAMQAGEQRFQRKTPNVHFLSEIQRDQDAVLGLMVKIRMEDFPRRVRLDGTIEDLPLRDDEGLGEETSFLFSERHQVLLLQRNGHGTRATTFLWYLENVTGVQPLELQPVLGEDALRKLQRMTVIRRFEVALARGDNPEMLRGHGYSVNRMVDLIDNFAAARIQVELSMGNSPRRASMNRISVVETARQLLGLRRDGESRVKRLIVTGKEDTDEPQEPLDLIRNRMQERISVERTGRRIQAATCRDGLREAFRNRADELDRLFPPRHDRRG